MSELYYAWNRKGQPITKVGDDFLLPIAQKLSHLNRYIFGEDTGMFPQAPPPHPTAFSNVVTMVEPKPIWMPRMRSVPVLPREEVLQMLTYVPGSPNSPLNLKYYVEGKLDEMRCYMVVWSDHIRRSYGDKRGGYVGYDLGLFTSDKYPGFKGKAVIHDIVAKWAYTHRKGWLEQDNLFEHLTLNGTSGLSDYEPLFVNRRIEPQPYWANYHNDVHSAVRIATNTIYPFKWYEGIVMKHRWHNYTVEYIEPNEVGKQQKSNIGGWEKLRWA